jgi:hypothetical protein
MGCSIGALGEHIKRKNNNVEVVGVETDDQMAKVTKEKIDKVIVGNIERINLTDYFTHNYFIINLVKGYWPYREREIHDKTHLRFFTFKIIKEMFQNKGLKIVRIERNYRIIERSHLFNRFSKYFVFLSFQRVCHILVFNGF